MAMVTIIRAPENLAENTLISRAVQGLQNVFRLNFRPWKSFSARAIRDPDPSLYIHVCPNERDVDDYLGTGKSHLAELAAGLFGFFGLFFSVIVSVSDLLTTPLGQVVTLQH